MSANNLIDVANPIRKTAETAIRLPVIFIGAIGGFIASGLVGLLPVPLSFQQAINYSSYGLRKRNRKLKIPELNILL